ncbi:MAG: TRAP transporter small permease [Spirochaetales bacterium]
MKRLFRWFLDFLEIYLPMATFVCLFITFIVQVFYRYVIRLPLMWPEELSTFCFIWTTLLSAAYIRRIHGHVAFTLLYDKLPESKKVIVRLISNTLVLAAFLIPLKAIFIYLKAMYVEKSSVLRIPFSIGYGPVLVFFILIIGHSLHDIIIDARSLQKRDKIE